MSDERTHKIFTPNPEILLRGREDRGYADLLNTADLALPDGSGVVLTELIRHRRRVRRWTGFDLAELLLQVAWERGEIVAFLGGRDGVAGRAAARWRQVLPGIRIEIFGNDVAFTDEGVAAAPQTELEVNEAAVAIAPSIVLVGLGAPKQERWIARHLETLPTARIMIGIGGTFDVWAGRLLRAPKLMRSLGVEWIWRMLLEPRRFPRVFRATVVFPFHALCSGRVVAPQRHGGEATQHERVIVVSSYPPRHCGIGAYAHSQVERLRSDGHDVLVISPPDGDGDVQVPFGDGLQFREAGRLGAGADRIIVHFQPGVHYRRGASAGISKIRTSLALSSLVRRRPQVEIVVHEATPQPPRWRPDHLILARAFREAHLVFHTDAERRSLERDYGVRVRARLVDHREGVAAHAEGDRGTARRRLGLSLSEPLFVCAGFLHPWKGFDRAIRAFRAAGSPGHLVIIGSVREPSPENISCRTHLRSLAEGTVGVSFVEHFVDDETFDLWIMAADRLVLPYRRAWSSGVLARARVLGTTAILSAVGGLSEQAGSTDQVFGSEQELKALFERFAIDQDPPGQSDDVTPALR